MKIFRGPRSTRNWSQTDAQAVGDWAKNWTPNAVVRLDGTIDKSGERHTDLGVQVEPEDVLSLIGGMFAYYRKECARLAKENERLASMIDTLDQGFEEIHSLAAYKRQSASSEENLLDAIEALAWHYHQSPNDEPPRPELK